MLIMIWGLLWASAGRERARARVREIETSAQKDGRTCDREDM